MGRSPPCCDKNGLKKGPWTPEEDQKLLHYIQLHGPTNWRSIPNNAGLQRCGKSCRLRWTNYLRPDIRRGRFTFEEEETIIQLHGILGNKWSTIATHLPGRTDNEIKNYWNTRIRKRLLKMGIDPVTHAPRLDLHDLNLSSLLGLQALMNPQLLRLLIVPSLSPMAISNPQMNLQAPGFQPNQLEVPSSTPYSTPEPCMMPTGATTTVSPNFAYQDQRERTINSPDLSTNAKLGSSVDLDSICNTQNHWSSPLPISTSTSYVNNNINKEDEKDVSYSSMFKFEIPQSLDFGGHG